MQGDLAERPRLQALRLLVEPRLRHQLDILLNRGPDCAEPRFDAIAKRHGTPPVVSADLLQYLVRDIKVGIDVLDVVVVFQRLHESQHLLRLFAAHRH